MRRLLSVIAASMTVLALTAVPAMAHVNENVPANETRNSQGAPFDGFIGPIEDTDGTLTPGEVSSDTYVQAHSGMECGALSSPNITALGPAGINFDSRFVCPADK